MPPGGSGGERILPISAMRIHKEALFLSAVLMGLGAGISPALGVDGFVRFTPTGASMLAGSSQDMQFPGSGGWIAITSLDQSPGAVFSTNTVPSFNSFSFHKNVDGISPKLFAYCAQGKAFTVDLAFRPSGVTNGYVAPYYRATLTTAALTGLTYGWDGGTTNNCYEIVSMAYGQLDWSVTTFDSSGVPTTSLNVNWSVLTTTGSASTNTLTVPTLTYPASEVVAAGGSLTVNPTAYAVSGGLSGIAVPSTGGYSGGVSVAAGNGALTFANAQPLGGPYPVLVEVVNSGNIAAVATVNLTVAAPPAANPDRVNRVLGSTAACPIATSQLLANDSSGATFAGLTSATTLLGGSVAVSGNVITYSPPAPDPGLEDQFTYQISDRHGLTAQGTVTVGIVLPNGEAIGNLSIRSSAAGTDLTLAGVPAQAYQLQGAPSPGGPWTNVGATAAGAGTNGLVSWTNLPNRSNAFYRAFYSR